MTEPHPADNYTDWRTRPLPEGDWLMRTGKKIGRNLYIEWPDGRSEPVGQVDTAAIAALICDTINQARIITGRGTPNRMVTDLGRSSRHMFQNNIAGDVGNHVQADTIEHVDLGSNDGL